MAVRARILGLHDPNLPTPAAPRLSKQVKAQLADPIKRDALEAEYVRTGNRPAGMKVRAMTSPGKRPVVLPRVEAGSKMTGKLAPWQYGTKTVRTRGGKSVTSRDNMSIGGSVCYKPQWAKAPVGLLVSQGNRDLANNTRNPV